MIYTRDTLWVNVPQKWWARPPWHRNGQESEETWSFKDFSVLIFTSREEAEKHCKATEVTITLEERELQELRENHP